MSRIARRIASRIARRTLPLLLSLMLVPALIACSGGGDDTPPTPTPRPQLTAAEAEPVLKRISLLATDIGTDYEQPVARYQTNDEAAAARPDSDNARQQFEDWGQVLTYNVQYAAPPTADLLFNAKTARMMNTATLFGGDDGASQSLAFLRSLPEDVVADFISGGDAGTMLSDTRVLKDIEFAPKGDESFAWRVSGKATFTGGFTVNYVADVVFVRSGNITGNVTTVALGQAPKRAELEKLIDTFLARAAAERG